MPDGRCWQKLVLFFWLPVKCINKWIMGRAAFCYYVSLFCEGGRGRGLLSGGLLSGGLCPGAYVLHPKTPPLCSTVYHNYNTVLADMGGINTVRRMWICTVANHGLKQVLYTKRIGNAVAMCKKIIWRKAMSEQRTKWHRLLREAMGFLLHIAITQFCRLLWFRGLPFYNFISLNFVINNTFKVLGKITNKMNSNQNQNHTAKKWIQIENKNKNHQSQNDLKSKLLILQKIKIIPVYCESSGGFRGGAGWAMPPPPSPTLKNSPSCLE